MKINWTKWFMTAVVTSTTLTSFQAPAAERVMKVDLDKFSVGTIVASGIQKKALVQIIDEKTTLSNFAECDTVEPFESIFKSLVNCQVNNANWFQVNDENLKKLSLFFDNALRSNYENMRSLQARQKLGLVIAGSTIAAMFGTMTALSIFGDVATWPGDKAAELGRRVLGVGMFAPIASLGLYVALNYLNHYKAITTQPKTLEKNVSENLNKLTSGTREQILHMNDEEKSRFFILNYEMIKSSLSDALAQMNMA